MITSVPVSVIGGYLGAGKTTLVNDLLASAGPAGRRLGVLVNDFGAVNVDAELIANHDGRTLALTNGCVCCRVDDNLGAALDTLLDVRPALEHMLLEASGAADPARTLAQVRSWPGVRAAGVVGVVNGADIRMRVRDRFVGRHVLRQLQVADVLLPNRCAGDPCDLEHWLVQHTAAPVVSTADEAMAQLKADVDHSAHAGHEHAQFRTVRVVINRPASATQWRRWLSAQPAVCARIKGIVDTPRGLMLVQRTGATNSVDPAPVGAIATGIVMIVPAAADLPQQLPGP